MAGGGFGSSFSSKIKGGKWTVVRFFFVSLAFTIGWMTVSSLLAHYKLKYGPAILLKMNIAYFLPSIPLLIASSCVDDWLDQRFGIAKTILVRQLLGLGGCAAVSAAWPFAHTSHRMLLSLTTVLGLVSGVAFSASYQLVARFANKNTISLGLGCVGSGIVTLFFQLALNMGPTPSRKQELILFELTAGMILLGMLAAVSLLIRHWSAIEASLEPSEVDQSALAVPLLEEAGLIQSAEEFGSTSQAQLTEPRRSTSKRTSLTVMLNYSPLDLFDTVSGPDRIDDLEGLAGLDVSLQDKSKPSGKDPLQDTFPRPESSAFASPFAQAQMQSGGQLRQELEREPQGIGLLELIFMLWPIMAALFLVGVMLCTVFPFFTYVPSSGIVGDSLPKVLFFIRLFADLFGRTLPRLKALAMTSQRLLFGLSCLATATLPLFFLYLKAPPHLLNDYVVMGYIVCLWGLLGYINTCAYVLAPQRVPLHAKGAANGALAIIYQTSHCLGLIVALGLTLAMFGEFGL